MTETTGRMLHRLVHAYWGENPPIDEDGDSAALGESAIEGWEHIARVLVSAARSEGCVPPTPPAPESGALASVTKAFLPESRVDWDRSQERVRRGCGGHGP